MSCHDENETEWRGDSSKWNWQEFKLHTVLSWTYVYVCVGNRHINSWVFSNIVCIFVCICLRVKNWSTYPRIGPKISMHRIRYYHWLQWYQFGQYKTQRAAIDEASLICRRDPSALYTHHHCHVKRFRYIFYKSLREKLIKIMKVEAFPHWNVVGCRSSPWMTNIEFEEKLL